MGVLDYIKKAAEAVLPGIALTPLNMIEKAIGKFQRNDKKINNRNRLISGAVIGIGLAIVTWLPQISPTLVGLVSSNISNTLLAQVTIFVMTCYTGFGLGMFGHKQISRMINKLKYNVTNEDHIPLTDASIEKLREKAHWIPLDKKDEVKKLHAFLIEKAMLIPEDGQQSLSCETRTLVDRERAKRAYKKLLQAIETSNATYLTDVVTYLTTEITNTNPETKAYEREVRGLKIITPPGTPPPESPPPLSRANTPPPQMPSSYSFDIKTPSSSSVALIPTDNKTPEPLSVTVDVQINTSPAFVTQQLAGLRGINPLTNPAASYQQEDRWDEPEKSREEKTSPAKSEKNASHEGNLKTLKEYREKIEGFRGVISAHYLLSPKAQPRKMGIRNRKKRSTPEARTSQSLGPEIGASPSLSPGAHASHSLGPA